MPEKLTSIPEVLSEACDDDAGWSHDVARPFTAGDHVYATDGIIAVRMDASLFRPAFLRGLMTMRGKLPDAVGMWEKSYVKHRSDIMNTHATGTWCELPNVTLGPCPKCQGEERVPCPKCLGSRTESDTKRVSIGGIAEIQYVYIDYLRRHGIAALHVAGADQPLLFRGDGFEGMVMPIVPRNPEDADSETD